MGVGRSLGKLGYDTCQHDDTHGIGITSLGKANIHDWEEAGGQTLDYQNETKMSDFIFETPGGATDYAVLQSDGLSKGGNGGWNHHHHQHLGDDTYTSANNAQTRFAETFSLYALDGFPMNDPTSGAVTSSLATTTGVGGRFFAANVVSNDSTVLEHSPVKASYVGSGRKRRGFASLNSIGYDNPTHGKVYIHDSEAWIDIGDEFEEYGDSHFTFTPLTFPNGKSPILRNFNMKIHRLMGPNAGGDYINHFGTLAQNKIGTLNQGMGGEDGDNIHIPPVHLSDCKGISGGEDKYVVNYGQLMWLDCGLVPGISTVDCMGVHMYYCGLYNRYDKDTGDEIEGWNANHISNTSPNDYQLFGYTSNTNPSGYVHTGSQTTP